MEITYDPIKNVSNISKHGVPLKAAEQLYWDIAMIWPDDRRNYGEARMRGLGFIGTRLYSVAFVERDGA